MFRAISFVLGLGLVLLWLAGLSSHASGWLTWLDGLAALIAIAGAASLVEFNRGGSAGAGGLALGLFVLWIIGLATGATLWLSWWTFAFACAFFVVAGTSISSHAQLHHRTA